MADNDAGETSKQPFVSQTDRPQVGLRSDTPVSDLTVRDLATLLAQAGPTGKDFWDGKDWIKEDSEGGFKRWKEGKEKNEKFEKNEKLEGKDVKVEKIELDGMFEPGGLRGPDPRLDQVIQALSGHTVRVAQLTDQVEALKQTNKG